MNRWSPYFLSILRIIAAFVYTVHGTQKLFGFPAPFPVPHLPPLFLAGGMIETFGGLLLLIGLFTRLVAFVLSGEMAVAYFKFHAPQGFWPLLKRQFLYQENAFAVREAVALSWHCSTFLGGAGYCGSFGSCAKNHSAFAHFRRGVTIFPPRFLAGGSTNCARWRS